MASDDIQNLSDDLQAQLADIGGQMEAQGVQAAPEQPVPENHSPANLPNETQEQMADIGQHLNEQGVQVDGTVAPESGQATDWERGPGQDVPQPAYVEPEPPTQTPDGPTQEH